jgi:hypothetical protein
VSACFRKCDLKPSLATMPNYATMVRTGVPDRQVSGPVYLIASANWQRTQRQTSDQRAIAGPRKALHAQCLFDLSEVTTLQSTLPLRDLGMAN